MVSNNIFMRYILPWKYHCLPLPDLLVHITHTARETKRRLFAEDIFKGIFINGNYWISDPVDDVTAFWQIMVWVLTFCHAAKLRRTGQMFVYSVFDHLKQYMVDKNSRIKINDPHLLFESIKPCNLMSATFCYWVLLRKTLVFICC